MKFLVRFWKKESRFLLMELDQTAEESMEETYVQNIFLHAKAILVKSRESCQCLIGSPNITDAAIGKGPSLNFESAV